MLFNSFEEKFSCMIFVYNFVQYNHDQCLTIVWHHVGVPPALVSFFHHSNILVEPFPLFLAYITKIFWEVV